LHKYAASIPCKKQGGNIPCVNPTGNIFYSLDLNFALFLGAFRCANIPEHSRRVKHAYGNTFCYPVFQAFVDGGKTTKLGSL